MRTFPPRGPAPKRDRSTGGPAGSTPPRAQASLRRPSGDLSLLSLLELSQELSARLDLYEIADAALYNLLGHFGCSRGAFWVLPEARNPEAILVRSQGIPDTVARAIGAAWTEWLLDRPNSIVEPVLVSELKDLGSRPDLGLAEEAGLAVFAPATSRRSLSGLVALGRRVSGDDFGQLDQEILQASVNLLGASVENTNVYNRAIENNRRLRLANEQLQDLDRLKSEFLRNMNHELRTPLTIIIAYLDSILSSEEEGTRRDHLKVIRGQTTKLHGMLLKLLDFGRLLEDRLTVNLQRGDVREALAAYYEERKPGISTDLREFKFSAASTPTAALFERERLLQIVDCLVDNAVKFSPQGSHIHLRVDLETVSGSDWVRVDVIDDGPGIDPERLPVIFDSFRQGDGSQTREYGGLGIGLAFARSLAEKMNGRLDVVSTPGQGSVFTLWLPAA